MLNDLTLLYYTANVIEEYLANQVRKHLLEVNNNPNKIMV